MFIDAEVIRLLIIELYLSLFCRGTAYSITFTIFADFVDFRLFSHLFLLALVTDFCTLSHAYSLL